MLIGFLARSNKKYADPTEVLKSILDQFGKPIEIGDEKDIAEFNQQFLSRISEALNHKKLLAKSQSAPEENSKMEIDEEVKQHDPMPIDSQEQLNQSSFIGSTAGQEEGKDEQDTIM